jgi:hypothetical protein
MFVNSNNVVTVGEKPVRMNRLVSVILNGVMLDKLAVQHNHDVNAMAASLMGTLSGPVQRNIKKHEAIHVDQNLRTEIGRRISLTTTL